jgi:putative CocE/NonD family hydrolase
MIRDKRHDVVSQAVYEVAVFKDVLVKMRDGVHLAADVYRPVQNNVVVKKKLPVLLQRTPYNKSGASLYGQYFTKRGYITVIQDCRGRFKSEGEFYGFAHEGLDGYDTVEWIACQPWSNGKVGTYGTSYGGWVQSALALHAPPHLTVMFPHQSIWNAGLHSVRNAGALEMRWFLYAFWMAAYSKEAATDANIARDLWKVRIGELLKNWPIQRGHTPLSLVPLYEKWAFDLLTHADYDAFWRSLDNKWMGDVEEYIDQHADVPSYYSGSWYDSYCRSTTEFYSNLTKVKKKPIKMLMGPWTHGDTSILARTYTGDVDFGPEARIDYNALRLQWFDFWLKGLDTGIIDEPPIRIFIMGGGDGKKNHEGRLNHGGSWRFENEWPLARTKYTPYYLHESGELSQIVPDEFASSSSFIYDPQNPVPTIGGNISSLNQLLPLPEGYTNLTNIPLALQLPLLFVVSLVKVGPQNQVEDEAVYGSTPPYSPLASRSDVLVFQTPPLKKAVEVTGPLKVTLWASSSAVDTDFTAKLIDVYPPNEQYPQGYAMNLADGIIRARYRNSFEHAELMQPHDIYSFTIIPYPISNYFAPGHRIRLDISSSNWPRFDLNPNTGEPLGRSTQLVKATNTIYHDTHHQSHIELPIIPMKK